MLATDESHGGAGKSQLQQLEIADDREDEDPDAVTLVAQMPGEHRGRDERHDHRDDGQSETRQRVATESLRHLRRRHLVNRPSIRLPAPLPQSGFPSRTIMATAPIFYERFWDSAGWGRRAGVPNSRASGFRRPTCVRARSRWSIVDLASNLA